MTLAARFARSEAARVPTPLPVKLEGARCDGLTDLMFSDDRDDIAVAREVCAGCPVAERCLERAVANHERFGMWAGFRMNDYRARVRARERVAA